jgi:hypothetical protein
MAKETTHAGLLGGLSRFHAALEANAAELTHLEGARARLGELLAKAPRIAT